MIRRRSNSKSNRNRMYYICPKSKQTATKEWDRGYKYFLWENELTRLYRGGSSSSGQTHGSFSSGQTHGSSSSGQCQACSFLSIKATILEAKLEIALSPKKNSNTSANVYEILETLDRMMDGLSVDH